MVTVPDSISMDELSNWWMRAALLEVEAEIEQQQQPQQPQQPEQQQQQSDDEG